MKKIFIIDALNFLFRSYYAIGNMTNPQGQSTNAVYGFIRSVYKIIKEHAPDHIIAVFDGPDNKKSRTDIYSEYKGHRKAMPEDLGPQIGKALLFCESAGIATLQIGGIEADDTMGSIAHWASQQGAEVYLCSSDKDLCQLVSDQIFVINPSKENLLINKDKVEELFGVKPEQMIDYLAMVGDASDNIPGLEGFGPKTVTSLLKEFHTLDYILEHPEILTGKKKETAIAQKQTALLSKKLATIQLDVEFPKDEVFFRLKEVNALALQQFYQDMHFLSLLKELAATHPRSHIEPKDTCHPEIYHVVDSQQDLSRLIDQLISESEICIHLQKIGTSPTQNTLIGLALSTQAHTAWYIPCNGMIEKTVVLAALQTLFSAPHISFYGHDVKYDLHVLLNEGLLLPEINFDTAIASYVLHPQTAKHHLDQLMLEHSQVTKQSLQEVIGKGKTQISIADAPIASLGSYCCQEVDFTVQLKKLFTDQIQKQHLESVFYDIEIPLIPVLLQIERNGIYVDRAHLEAMSRELAQKISAIEERIYDCAQETFNMNSPKQLSHILFDKLGLKPPKKTQTGYSTSAEVLESLQEASPIIKSILEYRTLEKLRSTYVDALPHFIDSQTGRIHCTFNQSVAATGRLSCQDPNLQNIPIRSEEGKKIRQAFIPQQEGWVFLAADYSQIELRLLAHLSGDPALIQAFSQGEDIHTYTASLVFGIPLQEVTPHMRYQAKAVNFGILYGQQAYGLSQEIGMDMKEASAFIQTYFARYPKVKQYLESCKAFAKQHGYVSTITGRKRPIPDIDSKNPMIRAAAERLATNTPLQGTAADLIKIAMIQIHKHLSDKSIHAKMVLQIHDELVFEVHEESLTALSNSVKEIMENVFQLKVPLLVDISIGKNWGEC